MSLMETSLKEQIIMNYIIEMEKEVSDWNTTYRQVKSERRGLEKYENDANIIQWDQCKNYLLEEDIQFLNARPDYGALISKLNDLTNKAYIVKNQTTMNKLKVKRNVDVINRVVQRVKQNICNYLLMTDESEYFFDNRDLA